MGIASDGGGVTSNPNRLRSCTARLYWLLTGFVWTWTNRHLLLPSSSSFSKQCSRRTMDVKTARKSQTLMQQAKLILIRD